LVCMSGRMRMHACPVHVRARVQRVALLRSLPSLLTLLWSLTLLSCGSYDPAPGVSLLRTCCPFGTLERKDEETRVLEWRLPILYKCWKLRGASVGRHITRSAVRSMCATWVRKAGRRADAPLKRSRTRGKNAHTPPRTQTHAGTATAHLHT
jgi:hypothetical protein